MHGGCGCGVVDDVVEVEGKKNNGEVHKPD